MTLALLDGDIIAYRAAIVQQREVAWSRGVCSQALVGSPQDAASCAVALAKAWTKLADCSQTRILFTGSGNFRRRLLPSYKANRGAGKPIVYGYTIDALRDAFACDRIDGLEADDLMGILLTTPKYAGAVCVSPDKDLRTVPGTHLNPLKDSATVTIDSAEADYRWLLQTLTGDTSDGYTGIPGCGPKTAEKILAGTRTVETMWPKVVHAYRQARLTENDALAQARVARILRRTDYDRNTKEIILWHPRTPIRIPLHTTPAN